MPIQEENNSGRMISRCEYYIDNALYESAEFAKHYDGYHFIQAEDIQQEDGSYKKQFYYDRGDSDEEPSIPNAIDESVEVCEYYLQNATDDDYALHETINISRSYSGCQQIQLEYVDAGDGTYIRQAYYEEVGTNTGNDESSENTGDNNDDQNTDDNTGNTSDSGNGGDTPTNPANRDVVKITKSKIETLAGALRTKLGTAESLTLQEMVTKISTLVP